MKTVRPITDIKRRGWGIMVVVLLGTLFSAEALTLTLKPNVGVPGKEFFVSDLVQIKDGIPTDILGTKMGPTPTFNQPALITPPMIEMAIKNQVKFPEPITWVGATSCTVSRPSRLVTAQDLQYVIFPALTRLTGGIGTYNLLEFAGLTPMEIPAGHAQASVELNPNAISNEWTNASVSFLIDGEVVLSRSVRFHWSWVRDVWVAEHDLPSGSKIAITDFRQAQTNALQGGSLIVSDPTLFTDYTLAKEMHLGDVLTQDHIKEAKVVYKGGKVTVHYAASGVEIQMIGVALEDGVKGATIPVLNTTSHAHLLARVIDPNHLEFVQAL